MCDSGTSSLDEIKKLFFIGIIIAFLIGDICGGLSAVIYYEYQKERLEDRHKQDLKDMMNRTIELMQQRHLREMKEADARK